MAHVTLVHSHRPPSRICIILFYLLFETESGVFGKKLKIKRIFQNFLLVRAFLYHPNLI